MQIDNDAYYDDNYDALERSPVTEEELKSFSQENYLTSYHSYSLGKTWDLTNYKDNEEILYQLKTDPTLSEEEKGELMFVLIRKNMRIVYKLISKRAKPFILPNEDLYFEGELSIKKAIDRYEFNKGTKFSTFLFYVVDNDLKALVKKASVEYNRTVAIDKERAVDNRGNVQTLEDIIPDERILPCDAWKSGEIIRLANEVIKTLTIQERFIICNEFEMRGMERAPQGELGDYMDISSATVGTYLKNALEKLRCVLTEKGVSLDDLSYLFTSSC